MLGVFKRRHPQPKCRVKSPSRAIVGRGKRIGIWALLLAAACPLPSSAQPVPESETVMRIGVLAFRDQWTTLARWQPTAAYLSRQIPGYRFDIVTYDHVGLRSALARAELDFVLTNAGHYVQLRDTYGLVPLATLINAYRGHPMTHFGAVIFTRADRTELRSLTDLRNRTFAASGKESFGGFEMAWSALQHAGLNPLTDFARLHWTGLPQDQVVLMVRDGLVDAGTVRTGVLERMADDGTIALAEFRLIEPRQAVDFPLLHSTDLYPEWPFARGAHVSPRLGHAVAAALRSMAGDSEPVVRADIAGWSAPVDYTPAEQLLRSLPDSNGVAASPTLATVGKLALGVALTLSVLAVATWFVIRSRKPAA